MRIVFFSVFKGDIFENYCHKDDLINIIRLFYAIIIMFSYPLECFVCRDVIKHTFFDETKNEKYVHILTTVSISIVTIALSFLTDCLGVVLEINVNQSKR